MKISESIKELLYMYRETGDRIEYYSDLYIDGIGLSDTDRRYNNNLDNQMEILYNSLDNIRDELVNTVNDYQLLDVLLNEYVYI